MGKVYNVGTKKYESSRRVKVEYLLIVLPKGTKVVGKSLGIETEEDDDENEYEVLAFMCPDLNRIFRFRNEEIKDVQFA